MKAEILYFTTTQLGGPMGDLGEVYLDFCMMYKNKIYNFFRNFKQKYIFPKSPIGPPMYVIAKYTFSAFTGKKN